MGILLPFILAMQPSWSIEESTAKASYFCQHARRFEYIDLPLRPLMCTDAVRAVSSYRPSSCMLGCL